MATFREWLVFEQIRENVYEKSLSRLLLQDALDKALEFCNMAVNGRWDLILESDLNDDDDGPVELADPFDGDEDAPEVRLPTSGPSPLERARRRRKKRRKTSRLPHEVRGRGEERRRPREDEDSHGDEEEFHNGLRVQRIPDEPEIEPEIEVDWEPEPEAETLTKAREIKRLWQMARWAAMLDRRDLVDTVRKIYDEELAPLLKGGEWDISESAADDPIDFGFLRDRLRARLRAKPASAPASDADDDPIDFGFLRDRAKAKATKISTAPKPTPPPAPSTPKPTPPPAPSTPKPSIKETRVYKVTERLIPLLKKLGYLRDSHLPVSLTDEQRMRVVIKKARIAKEEKGNDPPSNGEGVREMEADPIGRGRNLGSAMERLTDIVKATAAKAHSRTLSTFRDAEGKVRTGSQFFDDEELSHKIMGAIESITTRDVNQDGTAKPWDEGTNAFKIKIDDEESAKHYLNALKSSIARGSSRRDAERSAKKAAGIAPSSDQRAVSMDAPVAGSEGETTTMAGNIAGGGRTSDDIASSEEMGASIADAMKKSLEDMASKNPSAATMACLFLGLHGDNPSDCTNPATVAGEEAVRKLMTAMAGVDASDRRKSSSPLELAGYENMIPGGKPKLQAKWEFIKLIHRLGLIGKIKNSDDDSTNYFHVASPPMGDPPPPPWLPGGEPKYTTNSTPDQDRWRKYTNSVFDKLFKHVLPPLARKVQETMAENAREIRPKGWVSSCSWSMSKFLKYSFASSIKEGSVVVSGESPTTVVFKDKGKKKKDIKQFRLETAGTNIRVAMIQDGTEVQSRSYPAPAYDQPCPVCGGSSSTCEECEGCNGRSMNKAEVIGMETRILDFMRTDHGSRAARRKPRKI